MRYFFKSQATSVIATAADFLVTILLKEVAGFMYLSAHAIGLISGGFTQFTLNRKWVFRTGKSSKIVFKFLLVWASNFLLNTGIVWLLTDFLQWEFMISKIVTSAVLAVTVNFFLQKEYVFK